MQNKRRVVSTEVDVLVIFIFAIVLHIILSFGLSQCVETVQKNCQCKEMLSEVPGYFRSINTANGRAASCQLPLFFSNFDYWELDQIDSRARQSFLL